MFLPKVGSVANRTAPNIEWDKIDFDDTPGFRYPVTMDGVEERKNEHVVLRNLFTNEDVWNQMLNVPSFRTWKDLDNPHLSGSVYLRLNKPVAILDKDYIVIPRESILYVLHAGVKFQREGTSLPRFAPVFKSPPGEADVVVPCAIVHVTYGHGEEAIKKYLFLSETSNAQSTDLTKLLNHLVRMETHNQVFTKNLISASL